MESKDLIAALGEVPAFQPRLLELAKDLVGEDGSINKEKVTFRNVELMEAIDEARGYVDSVQGAIRCLLDQHY